MITSKIFFNLLEVEIMMRSGQCRFLWIITSSTAFAVISYIKALYAYHEFVLLWVVNAITSESPTNILLLFLIHRFILLNSRDTKNYHAFCLHCSTFLRCFTYNIINKFLQVTARLISIAFLVSIGRNSFNCFRRFGCHERIWGDKCASSLWYYIGDIVSIISWSSYNRG